MSPILLALILSMSNCETVAKDTAIACTNGSEATDAPIESTPEWHETGRLCGKAYDDALAACQENPVGETCAERADFIERLIIETCQRPDWAVKGLKRSPPTCKESK